MRRTVSLVLMLCLLGPSTALAVDGRQAQYVGGTVSGLKERTEGPFSTQSETHFVFTSKKKDGGKLEVPYSSITSLEYGQKAGRRVAVGILISPLALFSKKRKHYLTVTYNNDSGQEQAAVFELGKDIVRTTLKVLEVRCGKEIEYQDEEARKSGLGGS